MYKDLKIWQKAMDLVMVVYEFCEQLPKSEDYNIKSQLKRAVISVPLNIAEGKARASSKDFAHFLNVAVASLTECEVIIEICKRLNYLENCDNISEMIHELLKMINSLRTKLLKENYYE